MKKKIIIFVIAIMMILANSTMVQATTTATVTLTTSNSTVKAGETFTVTFAISCEEGINGIDTTYNYDTERLELVSAKVANDTNWTSLGIDNQITVICNSTSTIKQADVYVLTFKVKEGATIGETAEISTTGILVDSDVAINSEKTIEALSTSITIGNETFGEGNSSTGKSAKQDQQGQDNTITKASVLPKAGKFGIALIIIGILVSILVLTYKKHNMYKNI